MSERDPLQEFSGLIKQIKQQEYERGWREAVEAIQRAAVTMYRQAPPAEDSAGSAGYGGTDASALAQAPGPAAPAPAEAGEASSAEAGSPGDPSQRFVTPKWALLRR